MSKTNSFDIESTTALPALDLAAHGDMAGEYLGDTSIMRVDLERLNAAGEWVATERPTPVRERLEAALTAELRQQLATAQQALAELRTSYDVLQDKLAKRIIAHEKLRVRHEALIMRQSDYAKQLQASKSIAANNMKHVAKLLLHIKQQQAQIEALLSVQS